MKLAKISTAAFALLFFAASAFAQNTISARGASVSSITPASFIFTFGANVPKGIKPPVNNGLHDGCRNNGGNGGWGWDSWGGNGGGGCSTVPEGGTAVTYLSLAGLMFIGAVFARRRNQSLPKTTN